MVTGGRAYELPGLATEELDDRGGIFLASGLAGRVHYARLGSLSTLFFAPGPLGDWASVRRAETARYALFFHAMRERGVFLPPAQFEAWFLSTAHSEAEIRRTSRAAGESLRAVFGVDRVIGRSDDRVT